MLGLSEAREQDFHNLSTEDLGRGLSQEANSLGHLLWWGTNTRAVVTLLAASVSTGLPVVLVVDPDVEPPAENLLRGCMVVERKFGPVSRAQMVDLTKRAIRKIGVESLVLAPTSEYLQQLVHSGVRIFSEVGLESFPKSRLSYSHLSDKENLPLLAQWGLSFPRPQPVDANISNVPFVAKPRRNLRDAEGLKPFLVNDDDSMRRYGSVARDFFSEELVLGDSIYWCGFRAGDQKIVGYFQQNHAQVRGGGSISAASRVAGNKFEVERGIIHDFLERVDYRGPIMLEFRGSSFVLIEINPRFWGPLLLDLLSDSTVLRKYFESIFSTTFVHPTLEGLGDTYVVPSILEDSVFPRSSLLPSPDWEREKLEILDRFGGSSAPGFGGEW